MLLDSDFAGKPSVVPFVFTPSFLFGINKTGKNGKAVAERIFGTYFEVLEPLDTVFISPAVSGPCSVTRFFFSIASITLISNGFWLSSNVSKTAFFCQSYSAEILKCWPCRGFQALKIAYLVQNIAALTGVT